MENPEKCEWNEIYRLKRPNWLKRTTFWSKPFFSGNCPIGSTKNVCSIYFPSGITGILVSMVKNLSFLKNPEISGQNRGLGNAAWDINYIIRPVPSVFLTRPSRELRRCKELPLRTVNFRSAIYTYQIRESVALTLLLLSTKNLEQQLA